MRNNAFAAVGKVMVGAVLLLVQGHPTQAAEIKVLSVVALKSSLDVLGPQFEQATGYKLAMSYATSSELIRKFDAGETFDAALVWPLMIDRLIKEGKVAAETRAGIARVAIGMAVKKGAPKPDISTVDAFKRTLGNAKTISHSAEGASGVYLKTLFERLGIAAEIQPKLRPMPGGSLVVGPVVRGEVDLAIITTPYIVLEPGADMVGLLPEELQEYIIYTGGVSVAAKQTDAAKALIKHLTSLTAAEVLKSQGLDPATH
jgi:molybdate transport system substrate-binding protein